MNTFMVSDFMYMVVQWYTTEMAELGWEAPYFLAVACRGPSMPFRYHKEGDWFEPTYGEGPYCAGCHVIIPKAAEKFCPPMQDVESGRLEEYPFKEDMTETSRLGCCVPVTKQMDGMLVYVPDNEDLDIP